MKKWAVVIGIVLAVTGSALALAMGEGRVSGSWRYKMTVTVETPEGIRSGSAVREVSNAISNPGLDCPECGNAPSIEGEAVVVDLGQRGVLFALLRGNPWLGEDYAKGVVFHIFPYSGGYSTVEGIRHYSTLKEGKATLKPYQYPMLVTFTDRDDPKSVKAVLDMAYRENSKRMPEDIILKQDHFEELFGPGVKLKEITIEMTDDPVTLSIEKFLPWLRALDGGYLHGGFTSRGAPLGLHAGNFKRSTK